MKTRFALASVLACIAAAVAALMVTGPAASAAPTVKAPILGLIDRQKAPSTADLPYVHAYVVKVTWAQLQPTQDGPIAANNPIDKAIARVRKSDYAAVGMALKLRVLTGIDAPEWAKELGGAPIPYLNTQNSSTTTGGTIGHFWTSPYEDAYAQLQQKLAALYDAVPEIREITVSGCTTLFDEPFVRQVGSPQNRQELIDAGYTVAADENCIESAIQAQAVWQQTISDLDVAPYPDVFDPNAPHQLDFPLQMIQYCREVLGDRCGLQNNSLSTDKLANKNFATLYAAMTAMGKPMVFQTATNSRIGSPGQTLAAAQTLGANSVELPSGYNKWPTAVLQTAESALTGTTVSTGPIPGHKPSTRVHRLIGRPIVRHR